MPVSFVFAGLLIAGTLAISGFGLIAQGITGQRTRIWPLYAIGFGMAAITVASHYLHLEW